MFLVKGVENIINIEIYYSQVGQIESISSLFLQFQQPFPDSFSPEFLKNHHFFFTTLILQRDEQAEHLFDNFIVENKHVNFCLILSSCPQEIRTVCLVYYIHAYWESLSYNQILLHKKGQFLVVPINCFCCFEILPTSWSKIYVFIGDMQILTEKPANLNSPSDRVVSQKKPTAVQRFLRHFLTFLMLILYYKFMNANLNYTLQKSTIKCSLIYNENLHSHNLSSDEQQRELT